uniref:Uncharacterized protein n=1 Tax=Streptomyces sp. NBC_00003 TaxID=2903608 RepID=A0AAU2V3H1_9ACTN
MSASDGGTWGSGILGAAKDAAGDIVTELESFTKFQQRIDQLIRDLKGSPADVRQVGQDQPARSAFGGGEASWGSADRLSSAHATVIKHLEGLSKLLSDSIEGMGIAVLASHKGYANVDAEIRDRMRAISVETKKHFGEPYVPAIPKTTDGGSRQSGEAGQGSGAAQPAQPSGNETTGTI